MYSLKAYWARLTKGWLGFVTYSLIGAVVALLLQSAAGLAFDTDFPIVTVSSRSMEPNLNVGDIVIVKSAPDYEIGDVIVFSGWREHPIIHRVVMSYDGNSVERLDDFDLVSDEYLMEAYDGSEVFVTKGDNNLYCDQCPQVGKDIVALSAVHGKKITRIPYIGVVKITVAQIFNSILR